MVAVRHYVDNAPSATLTAPINTTATSVVVSSLAGFPTSFPYYATLDIGTASAEAVLVTAATGATATVTRNADGLGAFSHSATSGTLTHSMVALDLQEANDHHVASTNVHGLAGGAAVVGTTSTQTLTNKTLTTPTITGPTITGSGTAALASVTTTGNATVGGNAVVTGQVTAASKVAPNEICQLTCTSGTTGTSGPNWVTGFSADYNTLGAAQNGALGTWQSVVIPAGKGGRYRVNGQVSTSINSGRIQVGVWNASSAWYVSANLPANTAGTSAPLFGPYDITLSAGDEVRLAINPSSAGSFNIQAGTGSIPQTFLRVERIA